MEEYFQVGIITSTHGLRGEVKVYPTTDDARRFKRLKEVILMPPGDGQDYTADRISAAYCLKVESVRFFKQFVILKFEELGRIEDVEKYCRYSLLVNRKDAVRLSKDEYYVADLIGLVVRDEDGTEIGTLRDVMETGANDVYVISLNTGKELLLPAIKQCVLEVNIAEGFIRIHILDGLLDSDV
jgi:16S rRNA processing protein RimM